MTLTLFGNRAFADVISQDEVILEKRGGLAKSNDWFLTRKPREDTDAQRRRLCDDEAEIGVMCL